MINRTYKYLLKPNKEQREKIDGIINRCKFVVNTYKSEGCDKNIRFVDVIETYLKKYENLLRDERGIYIKSLFQIGENSPCPTKNAFTYLYSDYICFNYPLQEDKVFISNVGYVKYKNTRKFPNKSIIKYISVKHDIDDKYYVYFSLEFKEEKRDELNVNSIIGMDYSSTHFFVDSNGNHPDLIKRHKEYEKKIKELQAKLKYKEIGSKNYNEIKNRIRKINHKIHNKREDDLKKLASTMANKYDYVAIENLDLVGIAQSYNLAKSTYDNSYYKFTVLLENKMTEKGKKLIKVSRWFKSSQTCNVCGYINENLSIAEKAWKCPSCNFVINRDVNAAANIKNEGLRMINNAVGHTV